MSRQLPRDYSRRECLSTNEGRHTKRGTGEDMGPMVCKGYAPASNIQACLLDILPKALLHFDLLPDEYVLESTSSTHGGNARRSWISADLPVKIERESVLEAINRINSDGIAPHGKNHTFELLHDGKGYPPLAVLAFALEHQQGEAVQAGSLRGADDSHEFKLMRDAGFSISRIYSEGHTEDEIQQKAHSTRGKPVNENAGSDRPAKYATEVTTTSVTKVSSTPSSNGRMVYVRDAGRSQVSNESPLVSLTSRFTTSSSCRTKAQTERGMPLHFVRTATSAVTMPMTARPSTSRSTRR